MAEQIAVVAVIDSPTVDLDRFLDSISGATAASLDIVLADRGRHAGTVPAAAQRESVRLIEAGAEVGYARAVNLAVRETIAEFVVVADPDIEWEPGALDRLVEAAARWPKAAAFGPLIRTPSGETFASARALPSLARGVGHAMFGRIWPTNPWTVAYHAEQATPIERVAGWLSVSCLLLRRDAFDEIGGFDEDYFLYFEDVDLGGRFARAGWRSVYVPSAVVRDAGGHATSREAPHMSREHHRSAWRYVSRRYAGWRWLPVRLALRIGITGRSVLVRDAKAAEKAAR